MGARHLGGEVLDVVVGRGADHLVRRADLHDLAVAHDQDPVAELERLLEVVGDEHHRLAEVAVEAEHLVLHIAADQWVERRERLVEEQQRRVVRQRAGQPDALLHAAGELVGVGVLVAVQPHQGDDLLGPVPALLLLHPTHLEAVGDVVDDLPVRQQPEVLEDHRGMGAPQVTQLGLAGLHHVTPVDDHLAGGRLDQPGQTAHQRGLAGAGEPHHHEDLAGRYVEGDVADTDDAAGPLLDLRARPLRLGRADDPVRPPAEDLPQVAHRQGCVVHVGHDDSSELRPSPGGWSGMPSR